MLVLVCGISAIGKSSLVAKYFNKDEVIISPSKIREKLTGNPFDQTRNNEVFEIVHSEIINNLMKGSKVIYDATNLTKFDRKKILDLARKLNKPTRIFYLYVTDYSYLFMSNKWREFPIPENILHRQIKLQQLPSLDEADDVFIKNVYEDGEMVTV